MKQKGQVLVSILIIIAVSVLAGGVAIVASSLSRTTGIITTSDKLLYAAESGADEAIIKLLRDPNYDGETLNINESVVVISVTAGASPGELVIVSEASENNLIRKVEVSTEFVNNILTVTSWKQIP